MSPSPPRTSTPRFAAVALALGSLLLAGGYLGPLSEDLARLLAGSLLLLLAAGFALTRVLPLVWAALALPFAWAIGLPFEAAAALAWTAAGLAVLGWAGGDPRLLAAARAGAVITVVQAWLDHQASAWVGLQQATRAVSAVAGRLSGAETELGPSVAGVIPLVLVLAYVGFRSAGNTDLRRTGAVAAALALLLAAFAWTVGIPLLLHAFNRAWVTISVVDDPGRVPGYPSSVAVYLPAALSVALLLPIALVEWAAGVPVAGKASRTGTGMGRPYVALRWVAPAALLAGCLVAIPTLRLDPSGQGKSVAFLTGGMSSWEVPQAAQLGLDRLGMFGLVPRHLRAGGYEVRFVHDPAGPDRLKPGEILVVTNPTEPFPVEQLRSIHQHVATGGSMLVLGDHTDIEGSMGPLNQLLEPYAIRYRFDSAFTPGHWERDVGYRPGALTRHLDDANHRFQQSTGAGLDLGPGAAAYAGARWGFSDWGDRENVGNAFLGDYIYQADELLGDLPVVAMREMGQGRVIVFGDTSAFQNVAAPYAWPFLGRVFQVLAARSLPGATLLLGLGLVGLSALVVLLLWRGQPTEQAVAMACFALGIVLAHPLQRWAEPELQLERSRVAWIDMAHLNQVSPELWDGEGLAGLAANLARNGYVAVIDREGDPRRWEGAGVYVTVAPGRPFSGSQRRALGRMVAAGGHLVVASGWEEREGVANLLSDYGLAIAPVPLGPVPVLKKIDDPEVFQYLQTLPHFAEAWPVEGVRPESDRILYETSGYPVVVQRRQGPGRLTVVADSMFLMNKTLEEEGAAWPGNVVLLRQMFQDGAQPRAALP